MCFWCFLCKKKVAKNLSKKYEINIDVASIISTYWQQLEFIERTGDEFSNRFDWIFDEYNAKYVYNITTASNEEVKIYIEELRKTLEHLPLKRRKKKHYTK